MGLGQGLRTQTPLLTTTTQMRQKNLPDPKELVHHEDYPTREAAKASLFEYIEVFYNRMRLHSSLGYVSPAKFEYSENSVVMQQCVDGLRTPWLTGEKRAINTLLHH